MINYFRGSKKFFYFVSFLIEKKRLMNTMSPFASFINCSSRVRLCSAFQSTDFLSTNDQSNLILFRNKSIGKKKRYDKYQNEESSDEDDDDDDEQDEDDESEYDYGKDEIKTLTLSSSRTDLILKSLLGISRKKIETYFYKNKIRVNGKMLLKKSYLVQEDDEIDLINKIEDYNLNTLNIGRVKILKLKSDPKSNNIIIKAWRSKSLVIENYDGADCWREPEELN